tara:strand:- start:785 stop:958 length:174 start_codon:yes stop_codon:yes gene_type:complete
MSHDGNTHALERLYESLLDKGFTEEHAANLARLKFDVQGEMGYDKREIEAEDDEAYE